MTVNENNLFNNDPDEFDLPEGYFQKSADSILNKIEWQDEHKDLPLLLSYKNKSGFSIPEQYFESSSQQIELSGTPVLAILRSQQPFRVPENYFEDAELGFLSGHLANSANELQSFETLSALTREHPFKTKSDYFVQSEKQLKMLLSPAKEAKRITLLTSKAWYAAAAALLITAGVWTYSANYQSVDSEDCGTIACLDKAELIKTKTLEGLDNEELYELVNSQKLEEHLNPESTKKNDSINAGTKISDSIIEDLPDGI